MIEGLHSYESVLLICGAVLFVALILALFVKLTRKESLLPVFAGFLLSVTMIGFPSIQKIEYDNGKITILKYSRSPPQNSAESKELKVANEKVEARTPPKPQNYELLARGLLAAGEPQRAFARATRAVELGGDAQRLAPLIAETGQKVIEQALPADGTKVTDPLQKADLENVISRLQAQPSLPAETALTVSLALTAVGREKEAVYTMNQAAVKTPSLRTLPAFQRAMRRAVVAPP